MTQIEQIISEIRTLGPDQVEVLLHDLKSEYSVPFSESENAAQVESAWGEEIDRSADFIKSGTTEAMSGALFHSSIENYLLPLLGLNPGK